jgi:two-component system, LytTR family, response regulator
MSKLKCIIVEDEPLAAKVLTDYISMVPFLELQQVFKDAILATEFLRDHETDLILLDIHLPKLKGLAFLKTLVHQPAVIITSAYPQYAVEGFNQNVTDYLLKPVDFERFLVAVNKVKAVNPGYQQLAENRGSQDYVFLNVQKKKAKILFSEIIYIESQKEYIRIVATNKEYITKMSTHEIEALLPASLFKRVHRSFIVSVNRIESYTADMIEVQGGIFIPIGRGYRDMVGNL